MKKIKLSTEQVGNGQNANNLSSSNDIGIVTPIVGLPFATVKVTESEVAVIFGKYKITEKQFSSHREAVRWVSGTDWNTILNVIGIFMEETFKQQNNK